MLIVDAQIHLWNAGNPAVPRHRQIPADLKDDVLREKDAGGVEAAILTPHTPWDPNANELCIEAVRALHQWWKSQGEDMRKALGH
jgi:predicted TIM-barrel fold metal-dependent hydrolase